MFSFFRMHCGKRDLYEKLQFSTISAISPGILSLSLSLSLISIFEHDTTLRCIYIQLKVSILKFFFVCLCFCVFVCDIFGVVAFFFGRESISIKENAGDCLVKLYLYDHVHMFINHIPPSILILIY